MNAVAETPKSGKAERTKVRGTKSAVEVARILFLHGNGDGKRILEVRELVEQTGLHENTIRRWLPVWEKENLEMVVGSSKLASANVLSLPSEVLDSHAEDNKFIRKRLDKAKFELEQLPQLIEQLSVMISESAADPDKIQEMFSLLDKYLRLSLNEKSLTRLFIDLKKLWDEKVGLDAIKAIQVAHAKALKPAEKADEPSPEAGNVSVFRR